MDYEQYLFFLIVRREWSEKVRSRGNKRNSHGLEETFDYLITLRFLVEFISKEAISNFPNPPEI